MPCALGGRRIGGWKHSARDAVRLTPVRRKEIWICSAFSGGRLRRTTPLRRAETRELRQEADLLRQDTTPPEMESYAVADQDPALADQFIDAHKAEL